MPGTAPNDPPSTALEPPKCEEPHDEPPTPLAQDKKPLQDERPIACDDVTDETVSSEPLDAIRRIAPL